MSVYKDKKTGKWNFRVYVTDPLTEKRVQIQRNGFELRRDALSAEAELTLNYQSREVIYSDLYVSDLIDEFLVYQKKKVKETTYIGYVYQIEKHITPFFEKVKLKDVTRESLEKWYKKLEDSNNGYAYKNKILTRLKAIFDYSYDQYNFKIRYINTLPSFTNKNVLKKDEVIVYDLETFNKFISKAENTLEKTLFYTLFYTGLRIGELRGLTWNDVFLDNNYISINKQVTSKIPGKGPTVITPKSESSNREVQIPNILVDILNDWYIERSKINGFKNKWNVFGDYSFISENRIRRMVKRMSEAAKTPYIKLHGFRHSYTTLLYTMNVDPKIAQSQTGHSSISITLDTYTHLDKEKKRKTIIDVFEKK